MTVILARTLSGRSCIQGNRTYFVETATGRCFGTSITRNSRGNGINFVTTGVCRLDGSREPDYLSATGSAPSTAVNAAFFGFFKESL